MCESLANLLENALEASLRTVPGRRQIEITAYVYANRILLIEVENAFDGEVNEKDGVFRSSKRRENGSGIQSVTHIAEKPAAQVHLLIKMVLFPPRSYSAGTMRIQAIKDCAGRRIDAFEVLSIDKE
ncbi:MAG: GHKL domain-containing protein [Gemmiger sp.]|nr:GHKL domain-containing protein [Gemmiger sp.]